MAKNEFVWNFIFMHQSEKTFDCLLVLVSELVLLDFG